MTTTSVIHDARLPGAPEQAVDVIIDGGMIADIVPSAGSHDAGDVIEAAGRVAFPGLIDSHVHLAFSPDISPEFELARLSHEQLADRIRSHSQQHVSAGVTTVRDLGGPGEPLRRYARGARADLGPRVFLAGPVITRPHGHCYFVGDAVDDDRTIVPLVDSHADAEDGWIKVMVTGGALTSTSHPDHLQFDEATLRIVVERAHERGLRVAAHVLTGEGARVAVDAGVDSLEHGVGTDAVTLERFARAGGTLVPVLSPSDLTLARAGDDASEHVSRLRMIVGVLHDTVRSGIRHGVALAAGSDSGCPDVAHGSSLVHELRLLERLGLSRIAALAAATTTPAELLGERRLGRVAPGAFADLVLLDGDPLESLDALVAPRLVMVDGRVAVDRRSAPAQPNPSERNPG